MAEQKSGAKVSKVDAVGHALAELGKDASRADIQRFVKGRYGYDMTPDHITNCKSDLRKRAAKAKAARAQAAAKPAAVKQAAADGRGATAIALDDILAVKSLVDRLGAGPLRTLINTFSK